MDPAKFITGLLNSYIYASIITLFYNMELYF